MVASLRVGQQFRSGLVRRSGRWGLDRCKLPLRQGPTQWRPLLFWTRAFLGHFGTHQQCLWGLLPVLRLLATLALDRQSRCGRSVDGRGSSGMIANADVRRKVSLSTAIGVNSTVRIANGQTAAQILGFVDFSTNLGSSRAEAGWSHDPALICIVSDLTRIGPCQPGCRPAAD